MLRIGLASATPSCKRRLAAALLLTFACGVSAQQDGMDCNAVRSAYAAALQRAQRCEVGALNACGAERPRAVEDACRCPVAVNPTRTAELDELLQRYKSLACRSEPPMCNRACVSAARQCTAMAGAPPSCTAP